MAKKKSPPDIDVNETPAELPDADDRAPGEVVDVNVGAPAWPPGDTGMGEPTPPPAIESQSVAWTPPAHCIVTDDTTYKIRVDGQNYRHVSEAPDGRWVYELDL